jgi:hypothetical protein
VETDRIEYMWILPETEPKSSPALPTRVREEFLRRIGLEDILKAHTAPATN